MRVAKTIELNAHKERELRVPSQRKRIAMTTIAAQWHRIRSLPMVAIAMLTGCGSGGSDCPPGGAPCGTNYDVTSPTSVASSETFATISIGNWHTCMTSTTGAAWCWGSNEGGQLGAVSSQRCMGGNVDCSAVPLAVGGMRAFASIASSELHSCGLTPAGVAWCWGIAAQLGDGGTGRGAVTVPVAVAGDHVFKRIVASTSAPLTCGFEADGSPWCWGSGFGFGTKGPKSSAMPLRWDAIANVAWTQFAIGQGHACGLDAAGKAWCVGSTFNGLLGDGSGVSSTTPVAVAGGHVFQEVVAAIEHTCALAADGQAWCWGQGAGVGNGGPGGHGTADTGGGCRWPAFRSLDGRQRPQLRPHRGRQCLVLGRGLRRQPGRRHDGAAANAGRRGGRSPLRRAGQRGYLDLWHRYLGQGLVLGFE